VNTTVHEDRLLVVSDVHMGNALHRPRRQFLDFISFAFQNRYSVCINGDGVDIAQLSLPRLNADLVPSLRLFMRFGETGRSIYYTVGNHDIALEHFLTDMGRMKVVPFLNVHSGDLRVRVEHGHMYDGMFLKFPRTYFAFMAIGHLAIGISPGFYEGLHRFNLGFIGMAERILAGLGLGGDAEDSISGISGERGCFGQSALDVGMRGFDAVVFGHTHLHGHKAFEEGIHYYNTGSWFSNPWCVAISHGKIWFGPAADLQKGDPFPLADRGSGTEEPRAAPASPGPPPPMETIFI
jgi:UDP-2,3-diacylglucosamine pyrophosphatase LpxH